MITKMVLADLGNYLAVARSCNTSYTSQFASSNVKIGDTLRVRKPQRFQVTDGLAYQPQSIQNIFTDITVNKVKGVHFDFDQIEQTLSVEAIRERYTKPAALALASNVNNDVARFIAGNTPYAVGTPGVTPTTVNTYLSARDILIQNGLPKNETVNCLLSTRMSSAFVDSQRTNFNPTALISGQYRDGMVAAQALGMEWAIDETLHVHTVGAYAGTPVVAGVQSTDGGNNATMILNTSGWSAASTLNAGDRFTIGSGATGVFAVHPQTRQSNGNLQQFIVLNTVTEASGLKAFEIFPAITPAGSYQNVTQAAPNLASINVIGSPGTVTRIGAVMHKDAYAFLPVPFTKPGEGRGAVVTNEVDNETGLRLTMTEAFDAVNMRNIYRMDVLYGVSRLYAAELACGIFSAQ